MSYTAALEAVQLTQAQELAGQQAALARLEATADVHTALLGGLCAAAVLSVLGLALMAGWIWYLHRRLGAGHDRLAQVLTQPSAEQLGLSRAVADLEDDSRMRAELAGELRAVSGDLRELVSLGRALMAHSFGVEDAGAASSFEDEGWG